MQFRGQLLGNEIPTLAAETQNKRAVTIFISLKVQAIKSINFKDFHKTNSIHNVDVLKLLAFDILIKIKILVKVLFLSHQLFSS